MNIIVNGVDHECAWERIPYGRIVDMGLKSLPIMQRRDARVYFIDANQDPADGILRPRESVFIKEGTIFSVIKAPVSVTAKVLASLYKNRQL